MIAWRNFTFAAVGLCALTAFQFQVAGALAADSSAGEIFTRRILPIFNSPQPSSCVQCHLAGVDLKNYILPTHEKTFLSLRDQGLVDLAKPADSKILKLINMQDAQKPGANLIHQQVREAELAAFRAWIEACAADPALSKAPKLSAKALAQPARPNEVIRHARKDRLLQSFEDNIWAMRFRCMSCHIEGTPENAKLVKENGEQVAWMKREGAEATMNYLIGSHLIDVDKPLQSELLLKPLNEVKHGGGQKFIVGDQGYQAFRNWLEDYAKIAKDRYPTAASLPKIDTRTQRFGSQAWIKLQNAKPAWGAMLLQTDIYAWDAAAKKWEATPIASTDRLANAKWGWQHTLTLLADRDSARAKSWSSGKPALPPGKYLVKVYVDQEGNAGKNWQQGRVASDYVGQMEIDARWSEGYGAMTLIDANRLKP